MTSTLYQQTQASGKKPLPLPSPVRLTDAEVALKHIQNMINSRAKDAEVQRDTYKVRAFNALTGWATVISPAGDQYQVNVLRRSCDCFDASTCRKANNRAVREHDGITYAMLAGGVECKHLTIADYHVANQTAETTVGATPMPVPGGRRAPQDFAEPEQFARFSQQNKDLDFG